MNEEVQMLKHVSAVELGENLAAAMCGKYLAALGADIALEKVDRFAGLRTADAEGVNLLRLYLDAAKRVTGTEVTKDVDVVLNADLRVPRDPDNTRVIRVGFSDFGDVGPLADWASSELVAQAITGMMDVVSETRGGEPLALAGHQIDYSTGLIAFSAVMIALWERDNPNGSGLGQDISVSRFETGVYMEWKGRVYAQAGSRLERGNTGGPLVVKVRDGYFGLFYDDRTFRQVAEYVGDPRLTEERFATRKGRGQHDAELLQIFTEDLRNHTRQELYEALQSMGTASAPILDSGDILHSPQYLHNGFIVANPVAGNQGREPGLPATFNRVRPGTPAYDTARKVPQL